MAPPLLPDELYHPCHCSLSRSLGLKRELNKLILLALVNYTSLWNERLILHARVNYTRL